MTDTLAHLADDLAALAERLADGDPEQVAPARARELATRAADLERRHGPRLVELARLDAKLAALGEQVGASSAGKGRA